MSGIIPGECLEMTCRDATSSPTQDELLNAWRRRDFKAFEEVLSRDDCDPNFMYSKENYKRLLDVTVEEGFIEYTKALIKAGADVNLVNATRSKTPLHFSVESGNFEIMKLLIENGADVNIRDGTGSTILHYIVKQKWVPGEVRFPECLAYILQREELDLNLTNRKGFTAIHLAAYEGSYDAIKMLLEKGSNLDLDSNKVGISKKTAREAILQKYPELESELPIPEKYYEIKMDGDKLFSLLHNHHQDRFCEKFAQEVKDRCQKNLLTYTDGKYTFLQYCCQNGLRKAVEVLLEHEVDVNYAPNHTKRPIFLACMKGDHDILRMLLQKSNPDLSPNEDGENVLHTVVKYTDGSDDHLKCLQFLLRRLKETNLDINAQDLKGNTPLHYAVRYGGKKCVDELLTSGAYIGTLNKLDEPPLAHMSASVLGDYLDSCITSTDAVDHASNYFLTFNYNFLIPKCKQRTNEAEDVKIPLTGESDHGDPKMSQPYESAPECEPLLYMSRNSHLRKLLVHPVLTSFIMLKWQRVRIFYYVNLFVYFLFCLLLLIYILFGYRHLRPVELTNNSSTQGKVLHDKYTKGSDSSAIASNSPFTLGEGADSRILPSNETSSEPALLPLSEAEEVDDVVAINFVRTLLMIFLLILALRELFQVAMNPKKYFFSFENWMEIALLVVLTFVVVKDCSREFPSSDPLQRMCPQFCAVAILISLFEFVLLVGKHPLQSLHIEMFKTVSMNFMKFLSWYVTLIFAFALTFYILFRGCNEGCDENPFTNPGLSIFKTVVMLTGEFEAGDIPFTIYVGTSHLIFIAFVFLIAIVLINLLNGLAVTDTQIIRDDSYLYRCIALVKLISYIETMLLINSNSFKVPCLKFDWSNTDHRKKRSFNLNCFEYLARRIVFFPGLLPEGVIYILPNQRYMICFSNPKSMKHEEQHCYARLSSYYSDPITAKKAEQILADRQSDENNKWLELNRIRSEMKSCNNDLAVMRTNLENLEQAAKQNEQMLIQVLAILGFNKANDERY